MANIALDCSAILLARINEGESISLAEDLCVNCQSVWNAVWDGSDGTVTLGSIRKQFPCLNGQKVAASE